MGDVSDGNQNQFIRKFPPTMMVQYLKIQKEHVDDVCSLSCLRIVLVKRRTVRVVIIV